MTILFVHETCGYHGGVEQHLVDAAQGLGARGHRCHLAFGRPGRDPRGYAGCFETATAVDELAPGADGTTPAPRGRGTSLAQLLDRLGPDAVYVHKVPRLPEVLLERPELRVARMIHDHDLCCPRRHKYHPLTGRACGLKAGWWCALEGAFIARGPTGPAGAAGRTLRYEPVSGKLEELARNRRLRTVLVGSAFMRAELIQNGFDPDLVHVLPPVGPFGVEAPDPLPEEGRILYVGQLVHGKGVDLLLRALARTSMPSHLTVIGAGNAEAAIRAQVRALGLTGRVDLLGWVDHAALDAHYRRSRVVVVPSRWPEPFGMVGLEAMHHARPVIAFDSGGISDWLIHGTTGLRVASADLAGLAAAIDRVLRDHALARRLGQEGRRRALEAFRFEDHVERLEALLTREGHGPQARTRWHDRASATA